jgi:hypothetical protein
MATGRTWQRLQPSADGPTAARSLVHDAVGYWERRRLAYNLVLGAVVLGWLVFSWPHFRAALTLQSLPPLLLLAILANACYSVAYPLDFALQRSRWRDRWRRWRWAVWLAGTLFAAVLADYWIADEIYPSVG